MEGGKKKAIVLGATGLVGGILTRRLLEDGRYGEVLVFARRPMGLAHPKLKVVVADLLELAGQETQFTADEVYCCVGTTRAKTPDRTLYAAVDKGIPVAAAKLCVARGIPSLFVVSALGADTASRFFYNRVKGEMEEAVLKQGLPRAVFLQPSLIGGARKENRPAERVARALMGILAPLMVGPLSRARIISASDIADAMLWLANHPGGGPRITSEHIRALAGREQLRRAEKECDS
ncbi:NAD(P)H-binding protein [Robiginitalea marina]|uniref:NAD(P)H-binding protein n=1 Tax=Robiginitalea marina TaxID=2954105 RepID=A0ABT1AWI0_9FLAO|nr:NAD(P)H-binding protein [Robiginitalea marina]MCO5724414.1 NAD(P)H-binding protein [Robiginitalea marina]